MIPILRIVLAVVSGIAGLAALYLIRSPGSLPHEKALQLGAVTLLIAATLLATLWDTLRLARPAPAPADPGGDVSLPNASVDPVQNEVSKLLGLLRQHAVANENFSSVLERAKEELHESLRTELQDLFVREAARAADQVERSDPGNGQHDGKHDALDRDHDGCKPAMLVCGETSRRCLRQTCMARLPKLPRDGRSLPR